jgi:hypothetical protein
MNIEKIKILEKGEKLNIAIFELEKIKCIDSNISIRLIFNLWYALLEYEYPNLSNEILVSKLNHYYAINFKKHYNNPKFLFITGYLMVIADWFFAKSLDDPFNQGVCNLKNAYRLESNNPLYQWGVLAYKSKLTNEEKDQLLILKKNISSKFDVTFSSEEGLLESYFKDIFS